ncbi:Bifunctional nitrilase/nitrile hydratase NIT4A [Cladobotryum mycophilum]|uniref:Bifunctional nitrilase/nitrile hydratase NIT4A n=1 Tax=Cladobotryum mycophilum TaxID=491253 RepID=A0ABR0SIG7_9HYPO
MSSSTIRVGTASPSTQPTTPSTITLLSQIASRAACVNIDILLLPEALIGGYPRGTTFGCKMGERTEEGREEFARYFEQAVDLGDTVGNGAGAGQKWTGMERLIWAQGSPSTLRAIPTTIRGQRVNLAAAICWENYMPLLRQSLYAQNVNLYLAPTADARDSWMSLMRTVGIEGRCFVVSSNMCVRDTSSTSSTSAAAGAAGVGTERSTSQQSSHRERERERERERDESPRHIRRNSTITEEGFEIALPPPPSSSTTSPSKRHKRRKSVFDDDGNEIVLCCDADAEIQQEDESNVNGTHTSIRVKKTLLPPPPPLPPPPLLLLRHSSAAGDRPSSHPSATFLRARSGRTKIT